MKEYGGARVLYDRALKGYGKLFGPDHGRTLDAVHNLAGLLLTMGEHAEARILYDRAFGFLVPSFY